MQHGVIAAGNPFSNEETQAEESEDDTLDMSDFEDALHIGGSYDWNITSYGGKFREL